MSGFTSGFEEFYRKIDEVKVLAPIAIDLSLEETAKEAIEVAVENSPEDTGTLKKSWKINESNKQTGGYIDSTHSVEIFSDPQVISQNPKHPNGEYYPPMIEDGFILPNGKKYKGQHMLKLAFSTCNKNLKANLKKNLGDVFK